LGAAFCLTFSWVFLKNELQVKKYVTLSPELSAFFIGSAILGLLCSWVGAWLWNRASLHLPVSLAGQLTIFETIFGVNPPDAAQHAGLTAHRSEKSLQRFVSKKSSSCPARETGK